MQDQKTNTASNNKAGDNVDAAVSRAAQSDFIQKIVTKVKQSENILIALSRDPSVDELAAAIGLTVFLDGMQKHATAIYSGRTPDTLAFLQPDATFETNTDSLQDFIIALDKGKADHLRYKLEGDYVKVFITPYRTVITEEDLQFSRGDYNVDFVIAINVPSAGNLDGALREHGRIMHDASIVNITTGVPGRFGEIEWSNQTASSLCEMVTDLVFAIQGDDDKALDKDVATALLTGIVAATERFSNNRTNPDTLGVASKLMAMGADQQLITANIQGNEIIRNDDEYGAAMNVPSVPRDKTNLAIDHDVNAPSVAGAGSMAGMMNGGVMDTGTANEGSVADATGVAGGAASAVGGVVGNPAAQMAPEVNLDANPAPVAPANGTNGVAPEDVVVQPIIPGAAKPEMQNAPVNDGARAMVTEAPSEPAEKQVGATLQPPAPKARTTRNYAEMMEQALSEPGVEMGQSARVENAAQVGAMPDVAQIPGMPNNVAEQNAVPGVMGAVQGGATSMNGAMDAAGIAQAGSMPAMEPVAKPSEGILPPPPAPEIGILPPVQM